MDGQNTLHGEAEISWQIPEYEKHERSASWYYIAGVAALILAAVSIFTPNWFFDQPNYLFLGIIILAALVIIMNDKQEPDSVRVSLTDEGVEVGSKFYDYDEIKDFSLVYKPNQGVKNLYFEFKSSMRHRLSVPTDDKDPLMIRELLLKYLPEDLERTDPPASESIAKILKL